MNLFTWVIDMVKKYVFKFNKINTMMNKNICTIKYNNFFKFELKKIF